MPCVCPDCVVKVDKAMASIVNLRGVETSVRDVNAWIVAVAGKVNPEELRQWLHSKTGKDVKIVYPHPRPQNRHKLEMVLVLGSSSRTRATRPSTPPQNLSRAPFSRALAMAGVQSARRNQHLVEERDRNALKIKKLTNELTAVRCELKHSREVIRKLVL